MSRTLYVAVIARLADERLDADDVGAQGVYVVNGIDPGLSDGDAADTALASFHAHQGIGVLDDFEILVLDRSRGVVLEPDHGEERDEHDCEKVSTLFEPWAHDVLEGWLSRQDPQ
ncbi:hypothetical protein J2T57_001603 [Natronocella acetinitrilica]|uniref:Uncharacterized protein n=1 Tax=Natronocella acetinitrilica TaxID=414046 RepID=A0AAE3G4B2_9GAMM|nr:hypothetical protein [Natronocella acetinitrilica]MCP1674501.1 hypothetical protein [Natronocella acetinitrilica]